jgi:hypothetical protein
VSPCIGITSELSGPWNRCVASGSLLYRRKGNLGCLVVGGIYRLGVLSIIVWMSIRLRVCCHGRRREHGGHEY